MYILLYATFTTYTYAYCYCSECKSYFRFNEAPTHNSNYWKPYSRVQEGSISEDMKGITVGLQKGHVVSKHELPMPQNIGRGRIQRIIFWDAGALLPC